METEILRRAYKFRAYPNVGTIRRFFNVCRRAATPVWNACIVEREQARKEYREKLDAACSDAVYDLRRDLTEKEEKAIRRDVGKEVHWPTAYDQYKHIRKRDHPEYAPYNAKMLECVIAKVDGSDKSFRALWLKGHKDARPPRQANLVRSLTYRQSGWKLDGDKLTLAGLGTIAVRMHRPIAGTIKTVSIRQTKTRKWYVCFSCEITNFSGSCGPVPATKSRVPQDLRQKHTPPGGADLNSGGAHNPLSQDGHVGLGGGDLNSGGAHNAGRSWPTLKSGGAAPSSGGAHNGNGPGSRMLPGGAAPSSGGAHNQSISKDKPNAGGAAPSSGGVEVAYPDDGFLSDSTGREVAHPGFYETEIATVRRLSRAMSRKKRGSRNRRRARLALAKWHERIAAKRDYFLWHEANYYARNFDTVTLWTRPAKPPIQHAITSMAARRLCDAAYARFETMLKQKCQEHGTQLSIQESPLWQEEKEVLTENAKLDAIRPILRKARRAVKQNHRGRLKSLARDCARAATVQI